MVIVPVGHVFSRHVRKALGFDTHNATEQDANGWWFIRYQCGCKWLPTIYRIGRREDQYELCFRHEVLEVAARAKRK